MRPVLVCSYASHNETTTFLYQFVYLCKCIHYFNCFEATPSQWTSVEIVPDADESRFKCQPCSGKGRSKIHFHSTPLTTIIEETVFQDGMISYQEMQNTLPHQAKDLKISASRVKVGELQTSSHTLNFYTYPLTSFIFLSSKVNYLWHRLTQVAQAISLLITSCVKQLLKYGINIILIELYYV